MRYFEILLELSEYIICRVKSFKTYILFGNIELGRCKNIIIFFRLITSWRLQYGNI